MLPGLLAKEGTPSVDAKPAACRRAFSAGGGLRTDVCFFRGERPAVPRPQPEAGGRSPQRISLGGRKVAKKKAAKKATKVAKRAPRKKGAKKAAKKVAKRKGARRTKVAR